MFRINFLSTFMKCSNPAMGRLSRIAIKRKYRSLCIDNFFTTGVGHGGTGKGLGVGLFWEEGE